MAAAEYDMNDTSEFDLQRKKAAQQSATNFQARKDALTRRFASLGNLDSGARLKQEELAANEEGKNLNSANESINAAQNSEMRRRGEVLQGQKFASTEAEKGRGFASSEAEKGRGFVAEQAGLGREFSSSERKASEGFAGQQAGFGRTFAQQERIAGQKFAGDQATIARDVQKAQFEKQFDQALKQYAESVKQFDMTFAQEAKVTTANLDIQKKVANEPDFIEKITQFQDTQKLWKTSW